MPLENPYLTHWSPLRSISSTPPSLIVVMAANGKDSQEAFAPVLTAMSTMRDGQREQKQAAHLYLEKFQKSVGGDQKDYSTVRGHQAHNFGRRKPGRSRLGSCSLGLMLNIKCLQLQP